MPYGPMPNLSYGCTKCNYWDYNMNYVTEHQKNDCKGINQPIDYRPPASAFIVTGTRTDA